MNENSFEPGEVVNHVHREFSRVKLYVVKRLDDGKYKCRYLLGDVFMADEFEAGELKKYVEKPLKKAKVYN